MFNQHAKWLKITRHIPWRRPIASLNYLLSSHVWRQDHNGFSHQDPGFIDHVVNKKAEIIRVYLPPDANCLLSVADHCLRSRHYVNVVVAGKQPALNYLTIDEAIAHCTRGIGIWDWASSDDGGEPDVVLGCAGDTPTLETVAAAALLREHLPDLKVRVVNVVDLMRLQPESEHPHGQGRTNRQDFPAFRSPRDRSVRGKVARCDHRFPRRDGCRDRPRSLRFLRRGRRGTGHGAGAVTADGRRARPYLGPAPRPRRRRPHVTSLTTPAPPSTTLYRSLGTRSPAASHAL